MSDNKEQNSVTSAVPLECLVSCIDCGNHLIIPDPDPNDWFCDDDKAVVCTLTKNDTIDLGSKYMADKSTNRPVAVGIRPYNVAKEATVPGWCPLKS